MAQVTTWPTGTLAEIADVLTGYAFPSSKFSSYGVKLARGKNVKRGRFEWSAGETKYWPEISDELSPFSLRAGDVLIGMDGSRVGENWTTVSEEDLPLLLVQRVARLRAKPNADQTYLRYLIGNPAFVAYVKATHTGTSIPHISIGQIRDLPVPIPPIEVQRGIASALGALDNKIRSNRRAIALAEELCRAHFDRLFDVTRVEGGLPLSDLMEVNPRRSLPVGEMGTYVGMSAVPEFSAEIYHWEQKPAASGQRFINGDVLMARITPCLENGKTAVVDMLAGDSVGWGSTEYVVLAPKGQTSTPWIYCLVRSDAIRNFAIISMTGTSGRQRFHSDRFDQYTIATPGDDAMTEFNMIAAAAFSRMGQLRDENLRLMALRDSLLPELLSGRIRVSEEAAA